MTERVVLSLLDQPKGDPGPGGALTLPVPDGLAATTRPSGISRAGGRDRGHDRAAHRGRSGRDPLPAIGRVRCRGRPRRVLPGRSDPPSPHQFLVLIGDSARAQGYVARNISLPMLRPKLCCAEVGLAS